MELNDINTEQAILKAAEKEFIDKGFVRAKITDIAKHAKVNHAMLHYYFRTKENLFNMVFEQKSREVANSLSSIFEQDLPFLDKIKLGVERHFETLAVNPKLPFFIYSEIIVNEERKDIFLKFILPKANNIISKLEEAINSEVAKGTIQPICATDLIFNIVSLNTTTFLAQPIISMVTNENNDEYQHFIEHRKKCNVQLILRSLSVY